MARPASTQQALDPRFRDPSQAHIMAASGRELCWVAPTANAPSGSLPSGAPRPDDASKAQFVMAGLLARGSLPDRRLPGESPVAPARARRLQLLGQRRR